MNPIYHNLYFSAYKVSVFGVILVRIAIHAMRDIFGDVDTGAVVLIDAFKSRECIQIHKLQSKAT